MTFSRRIFLAGAGAFAAFPRGVRASGFEILKARVSHQNIAPNGYPETEIWGFDGMAPGPVIRVGQGERVQRTFLNGLPQPGSVHWHGIRIDNAMDGVPGLTQDPVPPGGRFEYDFIAPDAGTFWYHSHNRTVEQVARGLYGALIVDEPDRPDIDADFPLAVDDWRLSPETAEIVQDFDNFRDRSHAGRLGNILTVNGTFDPVVRVRRNDRLRLRLINTANARVLQVGLNGLDGWIMALDGMPLDRPLPVTGAFTLAPGQRADVFVDVMANAGAGADLLSIERDGGYGLMRFDVAAGGRTRRDAPAALPPNPMPDTGDPAAAELHTMTLEGGAMRGMGPARLGDTVMSPRELAQLGKFWALSGQVDRGTKPFLTAARGETRRISFVNETAFAHGMHTHGHHFRVIAPDGTLGPWRDTLLVNPGQTRQIALHADNPGDWLLHCHMLAHAAAGMMSWFKVT